MWRIDVGLSRGVLGAPPQVLEIVGDQLTVLGASWGADGYEGDVSETYARQEGEETEEAAEVSPATSSSY